MREISAPDFPCEQFPEEASTQRFLGIYPMRLPGKFMQRVRIPSGRITLAQWRRLAELAADHTPKYPLHLTTRQDVELHGLVPERVPTVQRALAEVGLTTLRTCGDTLRNVTCCAGSGICREGLDVLPLAEAIAAACERLPFLFSLPRKFKIGLSGCANACARPYLQDIGVIARPDGRFDAVVAGSLGARPNTGIPFPRPLELHEVVPLVLAALRLFNEAGDRENRTRARLRHVRERIGDKEFLHKLTSMLDAETSSGDAPMPPAPFQPEGMDRLAWLRLPLGDISPEAALALAQAVEEAAAVLRIGNSHDLHAYGRKTLTLPGELTALENAPAVVSCPGTTWCARGICDSRRAAHSLIETLAGWETLAVCLSGCPNNCAHAVLADIGMTGRLKTHGADRIECFRLMAGGDKGRSPKMAVELHPAVPASRLNDAVSRILKRAEEAGHTQDTFSAFIVGHHEEMRRDISTLLGDAGRGDAREHTD
jgi:sulfite reductase beta subunit-like hemoprotein